MHGSSDHGGNLHSSSAIKQYSLCLFVLPEEFGAKTSIVVLELACWVQLQKECSELGWFSLEQLFPFALQHLKIHFLNAQAHNHAMIPRGTLTSISIMLNPGFLALWLILYVCGVAVCSLLHFS